MTNQMRLKICSLFLGLLPAMSIAATTPQSLDRIVAIVNDGVITQSELDHAIEATRMKILSHQAPLPPDDVLRKQVLEQTIDHKVQLQLAAQTGLKVTDQDVTNAINNIANQNGVTTNELYEKVASEGMTTDEYRQEIHDEMLLQQVQQQDIGPHITITQQEVDDFMRSKEWQAFNAKEYHVEDILIALPEAPTTQDITQAKSQAEDLVNKIHQGMSFQQASAADPNNSHAIQGGDLGWRKLPEIPNEFAQQITHMKDGDVAGPILTPNGFHIVKLDGIRTGGGVKGNTSEQNNQVRQLLYQRKFEEALQGWITKVRSAAFINTHPETEA